MSHGISVLTSEHNTSLKGGVNLIYEKAKPVYCWTPKIRHIITAFLFEAASRNIHDGN